MPSTRCSAETPDVRAGVSEANPPEGESDPDGEEPSCGPARQGSSSGDNSGGDQGLKTVLYFPVDGVPRLVDVPRRSLRGQQYGPYVDGLGVGAVCVTFMLTTPPDHYLVVYLDQTVAFQSFKNRFVTHMLEVLVGPGKKRPWFGPLLVEYQRENAFTVDNMKEEVVCVIRHLHTVYERLHKDPLVAYDAIPLDTSVKAVSPREFFSTYGGDVKALLE
ncbi:hypothetical protein VNI00_015247 [Paramarasmius palmivorus]|uniref:Uncharacterized protein n=1 Tax=Paramarasmius palmivorus TaxID=297713 RepID=A0AAW0BMB2_9AGAR